MCFSATASFMTSAATSAAGVAALSRMRRPGELPLAAIPLVFGAQQAVEGLLWLSLGGTAIPIPDLVLADAFAVLALVVWPVLSPLAIGLVEPERGRRFALAILCALGVGVAVYGLGGIATAPYKACIAGRSLVYANGHAYANVALAAYVASTCLPPLLSSNRSLWVFGVLVAAGLVVSTFLFFAALFSVWCFFAATGSIAIYAFFAARRGVALERKV